MSANQATTTIVGDNQVKETSSASSDEDDVAGPCDQNNNPVDMKRLRRYVYVFRIDTY